MAPKQDNRFGRNVIGKEVFFENVCIKITPFVGKSLESLHLKLNMYKKIKNLCIALFCVHFSQRVPRSDEYPFGRGERCGLPRLSESFQENGNKRLPEKAKSPGFQSPRIYFGVYHLALRY